MNAVCACVPETGRVGLPLTSSLPVSSSLLPISCCRPLMPMTAASSGRSGNREGFSDTAARRKLAASVALGKQVEVRRAHGLLSTWRKRRELRAGERQNTTHVIFFFSMCLMGMHVVFYIPLPIQFYIPLPVKLSALTYSQILYLSSCTQIKQHCINNFPRNWPVLYQQNATHPLESAAEASARMLSSC